MPRDYIERTADFDNAIITDHYHYHDSFNHKKFSIKKFNFAYNNNILLLLVSVFE